MEQHLGVRGPMYSSEGLEKERLRWDKLKEELNRSSVTPVFLIGDIIERETTALTDKLLSKDLLRDDYITLTLGRIAGYMEISYELASRDKQVEFYRKV